MQYKSIHSFITYEFFNFFWNLFKSKALLLCYNFTIHIQIKFSEFLLIHTHQDLLHMPHSLFQVSYFLNKHHSIQVGFDNIFLFQNYLKDKVPLKILTCYNCSLPNQITLSTALISLCPGIKGLPANAIPNKIAANVLERLHLLLTLLMLIPMVLERLQLMV